MNNLFINNVDLVIFDVDKTLVFGPEADEYYSLYSRLIEKLIAKKLGINIVEAKVFVDKIREKNGGRGELALDEFGLQWDWYDEILRLEPREYLKKIPESINVVQKLKDFKKKLVVVTDGPLPQVDKIFKSVGLTLSDFNLIIGWEKGKAKPKSKGAYVFRKACAIFQSSPKKTVMIGDSFYVDIAPAIKAGINTVLIDKEMTVTPKQVLKIANLKELLSLKLIK